MTLIKTTVILLLSILLFSCKGDDDDDNHIAAAIISSISPSSGPKTTIVTINGSGFGEDLSKVQVFFNEVEASVNSVTDTHIKATVPARAYIGLVSLVVNGIELTGPEFTYLISDIRVSTLAGSTEGYADGNGAEARFNQPNGVTLDENGTLIITDTGNHKIRKTTPAGVVSTLAGSTQGFADGAGTNAMFDSPSRSTVDKDGNVYVAGNLDYKIRKIAPSGIVSTFAGSSAGYEDGLGVAAKFKTARGIVSDPDGNFFVADYINYKIRKITPNGLVSTFAGSTLGDADGEGTSAQLVSPYDIAIDKDGNLYVVQYRSRDLRKISPTGQISTLPNIIPEMTGFLFGIALDSEGNIYISNAQKILKMHPNGSVVVIAGDNQGFADGNGASARFHHPRGLAVDSDMNVYVADSFNHRIRKITQE